MPWVSSRTVTRPEPGVAPKALPPPSTVACRSADPQRSGPHHTPASTRSPPTLIHSIWASRALLHDRSRARPWRRSRAPARPASGPTTTAGTTTPGPGCVPPLRRAGSTKQPNPSRASRRWGRSTARQRAHVAGRGRDASPWSTAVAESAHRAAGSRSTASTRSPPRPSPAHRCPPRSRGQRPAYARLDEPSACRAATTGRVACSRPSGVHQRGGPGNRAAARVRNLACVAAAATTSG